MQFKSQRGRKLRRRFSAERVRRLMDSSQTAKLPRFGEGAFCRKQPTEDFRGLIIIYQAVFPGAAAAPGGSARLQRDAADPQIPRR